MFKKEYLKFLSCPDCRGAIELKNNHLICNFCKREFRLFGDIPVLLPSIMADDVKLSQEKWDKEYKKTIDKRRITVLKKNFKNTYFESTMKYFKKFFNSYNSKLYIEIGCGPFFIGQELAKRGAFVVGIDYSLNALKLAHFYLNGEKVTNYLLVCADITKMPFKNNTFDLLYGGGVIEHFKDTEGIVRENHRVLKKGGLAFNTVPYLNLGSLTYRQVWGNIPNAPFLKEIAEFVHVKLLKGRHMIYGYEYSFTKRQLVKIFRKAGFLKRNIEIGKFEVPLLFEYIRNKFLKKIAIFIAYNVGFFWPVAYILAKK